MGEGRGNGRWKGRRGGEEMVGEKEGREGSGGCRGRKGYPLQIKILAGYGPAPENIPHGVTFVDKIFASCTLISLLSVL